MAVSKIKRGAEKWRDIYKEFTLPPSLPPSRYYRESETEEWSLNEQQDRFVADDRWKSSHRQIHHSLNARARTPGTKNSEVILAARG